MGRGRVYERGLEKGNSLKIGLEAHNIDDSERESPAYHPCPEAYREGFGAKGFD